MALILIVDDERGYLEEIERALTRDGHNVISIADGKAAIETGCQLKPDLLIADWMLQDHMNGLLVADALQIVHPEMRVILMSAYLSTDLQLEAMRRKYIELLEKPFEVRELRAKVSQSLKTKHVPVQMDLPIAAIETDSVGNILYANDYAERLFMDIGFQWCGSNLEELFHQDDCQFLRRASSHWLKVEPIFENLEGRLKSWFLRERSPGNTYERMYLVLQEEDAIYKNLPAVQALLNVAIHENSHWPIDEHALILHSDIIGRRKVASALQAAGCSYTHCAATEEEAVRLLRKDPRVHFVILGEERGGGLSEKLIRRLKGLGRELHIVECG